LSVEPLLAKKESLELARPVAIEAPTYSSTNRGRCFAFAKSFFSAPLGALFLPSVGRAPLRANESANGIEEAGEK
jgi:hypothetical protein